MKLLEQISVGRQVKPPRLFVYGTEGIGKSSLAAQAPKPVFIQTEDGLGEIDCAKLPLSRSFEEVMIALGELYTETHEYQTVVIDSLDWLERLIFDAVCSQYNVKSIEKVDGGYGRGYHFALPFWRQILDGLDALRDRKQMAVIVIAHAKVERFADPESASYDRYSPRLNKHASALICEWADAVLFGTKKFRTEVEDAGFGRERTIAVGIGNGGGERILRTVGGPSCIAKNRYSLPDVLPLSWPAIAAELAKSR